MLLTTLSKGTLALFVVSLTLLLTHQAKAHSYADCIDWRFKDPKIFSWSDKNGACFGYARRFPLKAKPFAKLDSGRPNRHYQQSHKNPDPKHSLACSDGKQGEEPGADETMANPISAAYSGKDKHGRKTGVQTVSEPGGQLCIRWPAKNHAVPSEKNQPVTVALSKVNPKKDPTQLQFLDNIIATLDYKNCTNKGKDTDIWPCGGCFKLPTNLKPGNVVMQWRWKLNSNEFYTSCADIKIEAPSITAPTVEVPFKTTSTVHTPTSTSSASSAPSASYTSTSESSAPSTSQAPTSASSAPSASHTPTSESSVPSTSQAPTSASSASSVSPIPTSAPSASSASPTPTSALSATSASPTPTSASSASSAPSASDTPTSESSAPSASHTPTSASSASPAPSASDTPTSESSVPSTSPTATSASSASSAPSASPTPTSASSVPSTSQAPTSASSASSVSPIPTSASSAPSASHSPTFT